MKSNTTCLPRVVSIAISKSEYRTPCGIIHIADRQSHKGPSACVLHVRRDCAVHADVAAIRHRWGWLSLSLDEDGLECWTFDAIDAGLSFVSGGICIAVYWWPTMMSACCGGPR